MPKLSASGIYFFLFLLQTVGAKTKKTVVSSTPNEKQRQLKTLYNPYRRTLTPFFKRRVLPYSLLLTNHLPWPGQPTYNRFINADKSISFRPDQPLKYKPDLPIMYRPIESMQAYKTNVTAGLKNDQMTKSRKDIPLYHDSCDSSVRKRGSFKISDGLVQGFGTYEIDGDEVNIDLNIKISTEDCKLRPTSAPRGAETSAPSETTPVPEGGGETTTTPSETSPAPEGGGETTSTPPPETRPTASTASETTPAAESGGETTSAPGETTTAPVDVSGFMEEALKAHNDYRARHEAPPMTLNQEMSASAAEWAKYLGENDLFDHSSSEDRDNQGENIAAWCDSTGETATHVTKRWYDEVCESNYDFNSNEMNWSAGHFTQVVWIASTELGIGYYDKIGEGGSVCRTIVARYNPAGNGGGTFLENVKQGSFDKNTHCTNMSSRK